MGNKYLCLLYDCDTNAMLKETINNWTRQEIFIAYSKLHIYLTERGFQPKTNWIDNETYEYFKKKIEKLDILPIFST